MLWRGPCCLDVRASGTLLISFSAVTYHAASVFIDPASGRAQSPGDAATESRRAPLGCALSVAQPTDGIKCAFSVVYTIGGK